MGTQDGALGLHDHAVKRRPVKYMAVEGFSLCGFVQMGVSRVVALLLLIMLCQTVRIYYFYSFLDTKHLLATEVGLDNNFKWKIAVMQIWNILVYTQVTTSSKFYVQLEYCAILPVLHPRSILQTVSISLTFYNLIYGTFKLYLLTYQVPCYWLFSQLSGWRYLTGQKNCKAQQLLDNVLYIIFDNLTFLLPPSPVHWNFLIGML